MTPRPARRSSHDAHPPPARLGQRGRRARRLPSRRHRLGRALRSPRRARAARPARPRTRPARPRPLTLGATLVARRAPRGDPRHRRHVAAHVDRSLLRRPDRLGARRPAARARRAARASRPGDRAGDGDVLLHVAEDARTGARMPTSTTASSGDSPRACWCVRRASSSSRTSQASWSRSTEASSTATARPLS